MEDAVRYALGVVNDDVTPERACGAVGFCPAPEKPSAFAPSSDPERPEMGDPTRGALVRAHPAACAQAEIHGGGSPRYDRCERLGREIGKPRGRQHVRLGRGKTYDASGKPLVFGIDKLQRQSL